MNAKIRENGKAILVLGVIALFTFHKSFDPNLVLSTTDDPLGQIFYWHRQLPEGWLSNWVPDNLVGLGSGQLWFNASFVLMGLLPPPFYANWIYVIDIIGAGSLFFLFLRQKQLSMIGSLLGAVVYSYFASSFSVVHAGHLGKFGCFIWFAATFWALEHTLNEPRKWSWRIATGGFLGLTVTEQPDLALLYVWLFTAYLAFRVFSAPEAKKEQATGRFLGLLLLFGIISGLVAANVVLSQYRSQVQGIAQLSEENKQQSWDWATQWSYPPEETLEMIAPGFFGWRVDDPKGMYWGRTGRSAEYDTTKQGFPRFKLDTSYMGIVPIFLACSMGVFVFRKKYRDTFEPQHRRELLFWTIVAIVTLLLAFGRYFSLPYHLFYALPKMNIIRNPNKFLHLFSVAVAVLSAHGLHHLLERRSNQLDCRIHWKILAGLGIAALVGVLYIFGANESIVASFHQEFQDASAQIAGNMANALLRLAVSCGIFAVLWFWLNRLSNSAPKLASKVPILVVLLAAVDLYLTNRHYVEYYEYKPLYAENDLARFLNSDTEPHRSQLLTRGGFYNLWLTVYFPYHRIQTLDIPQMPRMPLDYQQYLGTLQPNPLRLWQLTNCKYLLGPATGWQQIQGDPLLRQHFELAFAYNVALSNGVVVTTPLEGSQVGPNTQVVIRNKQALPRVKFYDRWQVIDSDNRCLRLLNSREFDPAAEVIVSDAIEPQTNSPPKGAESKIEWIQRTDNVAHLRVTTDCRGVVLFNEKYDPSFLLTVDGKPAQLLRCNYIMKGAMVDSGIHEVRFEYRPPRVGFYISAVAWLGCLIGVPLLRIWERKSST